MTGVALNTREFPSVRLAADGKMQPGYVLGTVSVHGLAVSVSALAQVYPRTGFRKYKR